MHYSRKLLEKSFNGMLLFYCQNMEMGEIVSDFYSRKLLYKSFEGLYANSDYDGVIHDFITVIKN